MRKIILGISVITALMISACVVQQPLQPPPDAETVAYNQALEICKSDYSGPTSPAARAREEKKFKHCMAVNVPKLMPAAAQTAAIENMTYQQQLYQQQSQPGLMQRLGQGLAEASRQNAAMGQDYMRTMNANRPVETNCYTWGNQVHCTTQ